MSVLWRSAVSKQTRTYYESRRAGLCVSKATGEFMRFALKQLAVGPNVKSNNHRGVVHESE